MRFTSIDGKKLGELTHQEILAFFCDHIFFKFMDDGRSGMQLACRDAIDNYIEHFTERKVMKKDILSREEYEQYVADFTKKATSGFITRGTTGIDDALFTYYTVLAQHKKFK